MQKISYSLPAALLLLAASMAQAQTAGTINFSATPTSGTGSVAPVLTWSTSPAATSCSASGGWSGTKFASGSETLPAITASKTYTLTCSWGGGVATLSWKKPTTNTDGSALTNLAGYKVLFGTSANALSNVTLVNDPAATSVSIPALYAGTWYFAVRAVNNRQVESGNSNVSQKTITAATASRNLTVSVSAAPTPPPPTPTPTPSLKTNSTRVYDVMTWNGRRYLGRQVGTIALGKPCESGYKVGSSYYGVAKSDVKLTSTPRSSTVVGRCTTN